MPANIRQIALFLTYASFPLLSLTGEARASDPAMPHTRTFDVQGVSLWFKSRFSEAELAALGPEDSRVEAHSCSCYDNPRPHFPYRIVLFITPKGDLVGRAESQESAVNITPLAVRKGNRYCEVESEEQCYGAFEHPCDFTDFRFGPYLQEFFPSCKADDRQTALTPAGGGNGRFH